MTITPERLAALDDITLDRGSHGNFEQGACAMEVVSWLADEGFTDAPVCASRVIQRYVITLNDRWDDEKRQTLKPYLPRMIGTGGDGKDALREQIAARYTGRLLQPWLHLAGLDAEAESLAQVDLTDMSAARRTIRAAADAAWSLRWKKRGELQAKIEAELKVRADAVGAAVAVAVAVADAAAAVAAAVAAAAADAAAVAAAVAVAVAVAAAVAVAVAVADGPIDTWSVAYEAARAYFDEHPLPIAQQIADLAAEQEPIALEFLDALIDPAA